MKESIISSITLMVNKVMFLCNAMVKADMSETYNLFHCVECWVAEEALPSGREQK